MTHVRAAAIVGACLLLLAGCTVPSPGADEATTSTAASADPSASATVEPIVGGFEFVAVEPDEFGLAPAEQSTKLVIGWAERYCELAGLSPCSGLADRAVRLCIEKWDCHPALLVEFEEGPVAFVSGGIFPEPRVIAVWHAESDPELRPYGGARKILDAYLLSVGVCPDGGGGNPRGVGCPS